MTMLCYPEIFEINSELKSIKYIGQVDEPVVDNQLVPVEETVTAEPDQNLRQDYQIQLLIIKFKLWKTVFLAQDEICSKSHFFHLTYVTYDM